MQARRQPSVSGSKRRGFTLIELLVVISIIATLMSLILPAIQNARQAARRTQCLNYQRNIATAMIGWATAHKNQLPAQAYYGALSSTTLSSAAQGRSWVVELLPYLDRQDIYDRWDINKTYNNSTGNSFSAGASNLSLGLTHLEVLACPDDDSAFQSDGGLSYVVNSGYAEFTSGGGTGLLEHSFVAEAINWDGQAPVNGFDASNPALGDAEDREVTQATGVFWAEYGTVPETRKASANLGQIYDGSGNTIMLTENINAGIQTWANPNYLGTAFVFPVDAANAGPTNFGDPPVEPSLDPPPYINGWKGGAEGVAPYPAANHPGIVVVTMCDGSVRPIAETIDRNVYKRLITPNGTRKRVVLQSISSFQIEEPLGDASF